MKNHAQRPEAKLKGISSQILYVVRLEEYYYIENLNCTEPDRNDD